MVRLQRSRSACRHCHGNGRKPNPNYPESARTLDRRYDAGYLTFAQYEAALRAEFGSLERVPDEEITCQFCRGTGQSPAGTAVITGSVG